MSYESPMQTYNRLAGASHEQMHQDLQVLAWVGRMYLDGSAGHPEDERSASLPGWFTLDAVREAVERAEQRQGPDAVLRVVGRLERERTDRC